MQTPLLVSLLFVDMSIEVSLLPCSLSAEGTKLTTCKAGGLHHNGFTKVFIFIKCVLFGGGQAFMNVAFTFKTFQKYQQRKIS
jgi:hypothetical protein